MQNLPECSVQRRHYLSELKYKQEAEANDQSSFFANTILGIALVLLLIVLV